MKTVRFSELVKRCGAPEPHLVLVAPAKDKALQSAVKAHRVMTLVHANTGTKVEYGNVGFEEGTSRQYLIFPKSLRAFTDRRVVGIKYDLLSSEDVPESQRAPRPKPPQRPKAPPPKVTQAIKPVAKASKEVQEPKAPKKTAPSPKAKIIPFQSSEGCAELDEDLKKVKQLARQAMDALEDGKQVAAFNLLKRILTI